MELLFGPYDSCPAVLTDVNALASAATQHGVPSSVAISLVPCFQIAFLPSASLLYAGRKSRTLLTVGLQETQARAVVGRTSSRMQRNQAVQTISIPNPNDLPEEFIVCRCFPLFVIIHRCFHPGLLMMCLYFSCVIGMQRGPMGMGTASLDANPPKLSTRGFAVFSIVWWCEPSGLPPTRQRWTPSAATPR